MKNNTQKEIPDIFKRTEPESPEAVKNWLAHLRAIEDGKFGKLCNLVDDNEFLVNCYQLAHVAKSKIMTLMNRGYLTEEELKFKRELKFDEEYVYRISKTLDADIWLTNFELEHIAFRDERPIKRFSDPFYIFNIIAGRTYLWLRRETEVVDIALKAERLYDSAGKY